MRINILIINIIVLLITSLLHSQEVKEEVLKTNFDIYTGIFHKNLEVVENRLVLLGKEKIYCVRLNTRPQIREYLYTVIKQKFYDYKIVSEIDSASSDYEIIFDDIKISTIYSKATSSVLKNRKLGRHIEIFCSNKIKISRADSLVFKNSFHDISTDEFYFEKLNEVERGEYDFQKGKLPEQSFFEKALIPGIVILASAITIISFFAIRSK
jgi:hypothetical protein